MTLPRSPRIEQIIFLRLKEQQKCTYIIKLQHVLYYVIPKMHTLFIAEISHRPEQCISPEYINDINLLFLPYRSKIHNSNTEELPLTTYASDSDARGSYSFEYKNNIHN